jgi:hypothetical protein
MQEIGSWKSSRPSRRLSFKSAIRVFTSCSRSFTGGEEKQGERAREAVGFGKWSRTDAALAIQNIHSRMRAHTAVVHVDIQTCMHVHIHTFYAVGRRIAEAAQGGGGGARATQGSREGWSGEKQKRQVQEFFKSPHSLRVYGQRMHACDS